MKSVVAIAAALALTACVSTQLKSYIGKPLQEAMIDHGSPANAFDMPDGARVFQWHKSSSYTPPTQVQNSGSATPIGNRLLWSQRTTISGGQPITTSCMYTLIARWNEAQKAWVFTDYRVPKQLVC